MSDRRHTYLASLFTASTMDRWAERYAVTRLAYGLTIAFFAWNYPENFTRENWGTLDVKAWLWITGVGSILWNGYKSSRREYEAREALHHMTEKALEKGPAQINIDTDGPSPKRPIDFGVEPPDPADRPLDEFTADHMRQKFAQFDPRHINEIYQFFKTQK